MNVGSVELLGSIDTIQIRYDTHTHANTAKFKIIWHKLLYDNEKMIPLKEEQPDYPTPGAQVTIMYRIEKITLMKQISRDGSPGTGYDPSHKLGINTGCSFSKQCAAAFCSQISWKAS